MKILQIESLVKLQCPKRDDGELYLTTKKVKTESYIGQPILHYKFVLLTSIKSNSCTANAFRWINILLT